MKTGYLAIHGPDCFFEIIDMLELEIKVSYKTGIIDGILLFIEDYSVLTRSELMTVTRIQKLDGSTDKCEVEVVSGGGGRGVFSFTFGNENRRVNKIVDLVYQLSVANNFKVSMMEKSE
jgi:hypothetical protein